MTVLNNIPLKLSSSEYISQEHYFQELIRTWKACKSKKIENEINQIENDMQASLLINSNRVIEDSRGNKVLVETKTL